MATILVVDDRPIDRQYLVTLLGYSKHRLLEATDGKEALELAWAEKPDLVIADILMPTIDGFEFVHELRTNSDTAHTPVIFYTASYFEDEVRSLAESYGVSHILIKPSDPEVILKIVNEVLGIEPTPLPGLPPNEFHQRHLRLVNNKLSQKLDAVVPRLTALIEVGQQLAQEADPLRLLQTFCDATRDILGGRYAAIMILHKDGKTVHHFITSGMSAHEVTEIGALPIGRGILGRLYTSNEPIRVTDIDPGQEIQFPPHHPQMHSFLGTPIFSPTQRYGWLYLTNKIGANQFSEADEQLISMLAAQVALAYENAQRYAELQYEVAERQQAEKRLLEERNLLRTLIDNLPDSVYVKDLAGFILSANTAYAQELGFERVNDVVGKNVFDIFPEEIADRIQADDRAILKADQPLINIEHTIINPRGDEICYLVTKVPLYDSSGDSIGLVGINRDITERKRLIEETHKAEVLRIELEKEKQLTELTERFTSMISHEIRTPLTVIAGASSILKEYRDKLSLEKQNHYVDQIQAQVTRMGNLLNDLLTFRALESGKVDCKPEKLDIETLCRTLIEQAELTDSVHHEIVFACNTIRKTPLLDQTILQHILANLLSNAIKYSPDGGQVCFEIRDEREMLVFQIADHGIGIPLTDQSRLFEMFHRAKNTGKIQGTGLGLAIVKQNVELHGGTLSCDSQEGVGTTFTVSIPMVN